MDLKISQHSNKITFRNFRYKNLEYTSQKMTPETKDLFIKAKKILKPNQVLSNNLNGYTLEKTVPAQLENGKVSESYLSYPGNRKSGTLVLTNNGDIGMYYRHYDYMKSVYPNYDMNKDAQHRIKDLIE